jgi:cytochrome c oxidase subunit 2
MTHLSNIFPVFRTASAQAESISRLFVVVLCVCAAILAIVVFLVLVGVFHYRGRAGSAEPKQVLGSRNLEIAWTVIPLLIVGWLMILTARGMALSDPHSDREPDIVITGHQWWYEVSYPRTGLTTANEIHIPAGQKWLLRLESADVIHDFWVPELAPKMDMVPGHPNLLYLEADHPGTYLGSCAEYCGLQHAHMHFLVVAQTPDEFKAWEQNQLLPESEPNSPQARRGMNSFRGRTCVNCHALRGTAAQARIAPDLSHLDSRRTLAAGLLPNTPGNLSEWLKNPQAFKPGALMPNLHLTDAQAADLADYLEGPR